jgi:hypothetical protein
MSDSWNCSKPRGLDRAQDAKLATLLLYAQAMQFYGLPSFSRTCNYINLLPARAGAEANHALRFGLFQSMETDNCTG